MAKLTDEQLEVLGSKLGMMANAMCLNKDLARAAYEAVRPLVLAEAESAIVDECEYRGSQSESAECFADAVIARLTAPPLDPAVEVLKRELYAHGVDVKHVHPSRLAEVVAAVRSSDSKVRP